MSPTSLDMAPLDAVAVAIFFACFAGHTWLVERSPWRRHTLNHAMNAQRYRWMRVMLTRDLRMIDTSIMNGLQNGTAFFASTSLLGIGAAFTLLTATDDMLTMFRDLPFSGQVTRAEWEVKVLALLLIYAYAFFKFGWSYRLFNYASILIGATPMAKSEASRDEIEASADRAAGLMVVAGRHFNQGQRGLFFSIALLGWFVGPWPLMALSLTVWGVLANRQFRAPSLVDLQDQDVL